MAVELTPIGFAHCDVAVEMSGIALAARHETVLLIFHDVARMHKANPVRIRTHIFGGAYGLKPLRLATWLEVVVVDLAPEVRSLNVPLATPNEATDVVGT